jgi:O-antigen/teichoic acid export membrane protein
MSEIARVVADAGVDTTMIRNMATQQGDALARSMGAAISAKLVTGCGVSILLLAAMFRFSGADPVMNLSIGLLALTPLALNLGANYFVATRQVTTVGVPVALVTGLALAVFAATAILIQSPTPLLLVVAFYEVLLGIWLVRQAVRTSGVRPILSLPGARNLLRTALPLGVAIAVGYTYGKLDVFIIDYFQGKEAVGLYSVWARLLDPFLFVAGAIAITAYGHLSAALHDGDMARTRGVARRYALLNLSMAVGVATLLAVGGGPLVRRFLPGYAGSLLVGQLLSVLLVLRSMNAILTAILQAAAWRRLVMLVTLMNFTVALVACVSLASVAGVLGVVSGLIIMESLNFLVQATFARKVLRGAWADVSIH